MHPFPHSDTKVIQVSGDDSQIGAAHYEQVGTTCLHGMALYYKNFFTNLTKTKHTNLLKSVSKELQVFLLTKIIAAKLKSNLPLSVRGRMEGLCRVSDLNLDTMLFSATLPDLTQIANSMTQRTQSNLFSNVTMPHTFACSSFVTLRGGMKLGRNFDFPGVSFWDRYQVIQVTKKTNCIPHVDITTAGNPLSGISGINAEKIYVALHQHYHRAINFSGQLPFAIAEKILDEAKSLEDAKKILINQTTTSSWAFVVADGKSGSAFVCEKTPKCLSFRDLDPETSSLTHTNFYQSSVCREEEFATSERMNWDNFFRNERLKDLLADYQYTPSIEDCVNIVSNHYDPFYKHEAVAGRTIGVAHNVASYVVDMENFQLFLAEGACPVQLSHYQGYDLAELFSGSTDKMSRSIAGYQFRDKKLKESRERYSISFVNSHNLDFEAAKNELQKALEVQMNPSMTITLAQLMLKLGLYEESISALENSRNYIEDMCREKGLKIQPPEYFETILWLGRSHQLLRNDIKANEYYSLLRGNSSVRDRSIRSWVSKNPRYSKEKIESLYIPYSIFASVP